LGNAFGAKVTAFSGDRQFYQEYQPVKGYMSSVDPRIHLGFGQIEQLDSLRIVWPDGSASLMTDVTSNQFLKLSPGAGIKTTIISSRSNSQTFHIKDSRIPFRHQESEFIDFDRDRLRFWMISNEGPQAAKADVNGDGLEDIFIPGAKGQPSSLLLQRSSGEFIPSQLEVFSRDALAEDVTAHFFDANGDGHADLLVGSGGTEFGDRSPVFSDRLYLNDGRGNFQKSAQSFTSSPTAFILSWDLDADGDEDLVVGSRAIPFSYGIPTGLQIWENDGKGNFTEISESLNPALSQIGMLTAG